MSRWTLRGRTSRARRERRWGGGETGEERGEEVEDGGEEVEGKEDEGEGEEVPTDVFLPGERLTFPQALRLYTVNAAYAAGCEDHLGRVAEGFAADLVLVDPHVGADSRLLLGCRPEMVLVGGREVYCRGGGDGDGEGEGEGGGMEGGEAGGRFCPCCVRGPRAGTRRAAGSRAWKDEAWEAAMLEGSGSSSVSTSEEYCVMVGTGKGVGKARGRGRGKGMLK